MCGFVGFVGQAENKSDVLKKMMDTIVHRGPDAEGQYMDDQIALGFRRLSIIDVEALSQPMANEDETLWLVFNGEIYNYQDLRADLMAKGHVFKTQTDSEVLVHGYEEYGKDLLPMLRGMFSFAIWDTKTEELFIARDQFGIKPLYYAKFGDTFFFGSEIKSFLPHPKFEKKMNEEALRPYLSFQYPVLDETFFKGVFRMPQASILTYKNGEISIEKYWQVEYNPVERPMETVVDEIDTALRESVEAHRLSEVPLGSFLSSGVDSSYVAACLMPEKTFTVGFSQEKFSEIDSAKALSDQLGIENHSKVLTSKECHDAFSDIQYHADEPEANPSAIPLYFLARLAREHVTVLLSGEGADELFAGYPFYQTPRVVEKFKRVVPGPLRKLAYKVTKPLPEFKGKNFLEKGGGRVEDYFIGQAKLFSSKDAKQILKPTYHKGKSMEEITHPIYAEVADKDDLTKMQYLDMHLWMARDILLKADKMSMAHSIEVRVPFLDKKMMDLAASIPSEMRLNSSETKIPLRRAAARALPEEWANREKLGFPTPVRFWLQEEEIYQAVKTAINSDYANEFFDTSILNRMLEQHKSGAKNHSRKLWTIYTFLVWYKRFFVDM